MVGIVARLTEVMSWLVRQKVHSETVRVCSVACWRLSEVYSSRYPGKRDQSAMLSQACRSHTQTKPLHLLQARILQGIQW